MRKIYEETIIKTKLALAKQKVFTFDQLLEKLECSTRWGRAKIKQWDALTSYNKNGRYYAMPSVPKFDSNGLWRYRDIYFSKHGTLKNTFVKLARQAEAGLSAKETGQILGLSPRSFLHHFRDVEGIRREKHGGVYIYFSDDDSTYAKQKAKRVESLARSSEPLSKSDAIMMLAAVIRDQELTPEKIMKLPEVKKSRLSPAAVSDFMTRHDLVKKTADTKP